MKKLPERKRFFQAVSRSINKNSQLLQLRWLLS